MATRPRGNRYLVVFPDATERLLNQREMVSVLVKAAHACADAAKTTTPNVSGEHVAAIVTEPRETVDGIPEVPFGSSSSTWHLREFGSVNNPPYRPLTRAVEAVGLEFRPS